MTIHTPPATPVPAVESLLAETDASLIARIQRGDTRAGDLLYERYQRRVLHKARQYFPDPDAAEDLAGAVWERVWRSLPRYQERGRFAGWLMKVLQSLAVSQVRRRRTRIEASVVAADLNELAEVLTAGDTGAPDRLALAAERSIILYEALAALKQTNRDYFDAVLERWLEDVGTEPDQASTGLKRVRRHRGLLWLRRYLLARCPELFADLAERPPSGKEPSRRPAKRPLAGRIPMKETADGCKPAERRGRQPPPKSRKPAGLPRQSFRVAPPERG
jgi:RNA polymerase sigma-70 factor, ECF subfamily